MQAGKFRHRVIVQSPSGQADSSGAHTTVWTDVLRVMARIEPLSVREAFMAAQEHASATHRISLRYRQGLSGMDGSWRVLQGSRAFILVGLPINVDEHNREVQLLCVEGLRDE